jgi:hypothetical protein
MKIAVEAPMREFLGWAAGYPRTDAQLRGRNSR